MTFKNLSKFLKGVSNAKINPKGLMGFQRKINDRFGSWSSKFAFD